MMNTFTVQNVWRPARMAPRYAPPRMAQQTLAQANEVPPRERMSFIPATLIGIGVGAFTGAFMSSVFGHKKRMGDDALIGAGVGFVVSGLMTSVF